MNRPLVMAPLVSRKPSTDCTEHRITWIASDAWLHGCITKGFSVIRLFPLTKPLFNDVCALPERIKRAMARTFLRACTNVE